MTGSEASRPARLFAFVCERWLTIDARSLGLFRLAFGALLLVDLVRRAPMWVAFHTNEGLLPNAFLLERGGSAHVSLLLALSTPAQAWLAFAALGAVYTAFLVGWRTRLFQLLAWIGLLSVHTRAILVENGGDVVMNLLAAFTLFLPLGRRFSLDAVRAGPEAATRPAPVSLAAGGLLVQFAAIYLFNTLHKGGATWRTGTAVHFVLFQSRVVTSLGGLVAPLVTPAISRALSWSTLLVEGAAPLLLLTPWRRVEARRIAIVALFGLHLGIALVMNVGLFSFAMMMLYPLLLLPEEWARIEATGAWQRLHSGFTRAATRLVGPIVPSPPPSEAPLARRLAQAGTGLREAAIAVVLASCALQLLHENRAIPTWARPPYPPPARALVGAARLMQGWNMFAPNVPQQDGMLVVDARTIDGRRVDPFAWAALGEGGAPREEIPARLGLDQLWRSYASRIHDEKNRASLEPLAAWITRHHERTGRAEDRLESFEVIWRTDQSPRPGQSTPTNRQSFSLLARGRPATLPPMPKRPATEARSHATE